MKNILCSDRTGGVLFDVQQLRERQSISRHPLERARTLDCTPREHLIATIAALVKVVEDMDAQALREMSEEEKFMGEKS